MGQHFWKAQNKGNRQHFIYPNQTTSNFWLVCAQIPTGMDLWGIEDIGNRGLRFQFGRSHLLEPPRKGVLQGLPWLRHENIANHQITQAKQYRYNVFGGMQPKSYKIPGGHDNQRLQDSLRHKKIIKIRNNHQKKILPQFQLKLSLSQQYFVQKNL